MLTGHAGAAVVLLLALGAVPAAAQPRPPFVIGGTTVAAGQRADVDLPVPAGGTDGATRVPVTVFHGAAPGPVLALTAGVHGYEFVPILAAQRLLARIDAATLRGTVVLVRLAHVEAFEHRVPYVNPHDRKNLNRMFPGRPDGTQAERIAWVLTTEVIRRCDLHIELHGGDGAEWMEPFAGPYGGPLAAAQHDRARAMALALGFRHVITYEMKSQAQVDAGRSLNRQAVADGKPTVLVEIGQNGQRDETSIAALVSGLENVLKTLAMTAGTPAPPRGDTRWFGDSAEASATKTGIFTPVATSGRPVKTGDLIGTVTDYAGREIERIVSPVDGYVMYGLAGPPVRAGESVVTIGIPAAVPR
jgi:uncharacterized protein